MPSPLDHAEQFIRVETARAPDGMGGAVETMQDGAEFSALCALKNTDNPYIAEQRAVNSIYTLWLSKDLDLKPLDIIRRAADGQLFRITSNPNDRAAPVKSNLNYKVCSAEKYEPLEGQS
jgi:hypothetical protein